MDGPFTQCKIIWNEASRHITGRPKSATQPPRLQPCRNTHLSSASVDEAGRVRYTVEASGGAGAVIEGHTGGGAGSLEDAARVLGDGHTVTPSGPRPTSGLRHPSSSEPPLVASSIPTPRPASPPFPRPSGGIHSGRRSLSPLSLSLAFPFITRFPPSFLSSSYLSRSVSLAIRTSCKESSRARGGHWRWPYSNPSQSVGTELQIHHTSRGIPIIINHIRPTYLDCFR